MARLTAQDEYLLTTLSGYIQLIDVILPSFKPILDETATWIVENSIKYMKKAEQSLRDGNGIFRDEQSVGLIQDGRIPLSNVDCMSAYFLVNNKAAMHVMLDAILETINDGNPKKVNVIGLKEQAAAVESAAMAIDDAIKNSPQTAVLADVTQNMNKELSDFAFRICMAATDQLPEIGPLQKGAHRLGQIAGAMLQKVKNGLPFGS